MSEVLFWVLCSILCVNRLVISMLCSSIFLLDFSPHPRFNGWITIFSSDCFVFTFPCFEVEFRCIIFSCFTIRVNLDFQSVCSWCNNVFNLQATKTPLIPKDGKPTFLYVHNYANPSNFLWMNWVYAFIEILICGNWESKLLSWERGYYCNSP